MNHRVRAILHTVLVNVAILVCSGALIAFAVTPHTPIHSSEITAAYAHYLEHPSVETKRNYEQTVDRVNRPLHTLEYLSLTCGLFLPLVRGFLWWKERQGKAGSR